MADALVQLNIDGESTDGALRLQLRFPETMEVPQAPFTANLVGHMVTETTWLASISMEPSESHEWSGEWRNWRSSGCDSGLLELRSIQFEGNGAEEPSASNPIELIADRDYERVLFLLAGDDGRVTVGAEAQHALEVVLHEREALYRTPIVVNENGTAFRAAVLADGCLLSRVMFVPGLEAIPIEKSTLGSAAPEVMNAAIAQLDFAGGVDPNWWIGEYAQRRPTLLLVARRIIAHDAPLAVAELRNRMRILLNLLAVSRGATASLIGGYLEAETDTKDWTPVGAWIETDTYSGNLLTGFLSGENQTGLFRRWGKVESDPRIGLWLSLFADALAESRWDFRFFRFFNLLETIALEVVGNGKTVVDGMGNVVKDASGNPATTSSARGKVYAALIAASHGGSSVDSNHCVRPGVTLWQEVRVWTDIRNAVAHEGGFRNWDPLQASSSARNRRVAAAFESAISNEPLVPAEEQYGRAIRDASALVITDCFREKS
jgi:hypothetical protein